MKRCGRCRKTKPPAAFYPDAQHKSGLASYCKPCNREARRKWRDANREHVRAQERARNSYKREWEHNHRAPCPRCGEPMAAGSQSPSQRPDLCRSCRHAVEAERVAKRDQELERLWANGKTYPDIMAHFGWSKGHLNQEMNRARARGADLPYRYRTGKRNATRFPHLQKAA